MTQRTNQNLIFIAGLAVLLLALVAIWNAPRPQPVAPPNPPAAVEEDVPDFAALITEDYTPPELLGLPDDHAEVAAEAYAQYPDAFQVADPATAAENAKKNVRIYEITRRVALAGKPPGQDLPCWFQLTGDCAGQASARAKSERIGVQVFKGVSVDASPVHPSYEYGIGRRHADMLGLPRLPCGKAGAYPSIIAQAGRDWGSLPVAEGPKYDGRLSNDWGCRGIPTRYLDLGKANAGGDVYPIRSVDEAIEALVNLYPLTIGVPYSPGRPYVAHGRHVIDFGNSGGGHAMAITAYDGSAGDGYFFLQNSHGPKAQGATQPLQGEPLGGFWVTRKQMARWLGNRGQTQCWAHSDVAGFPAEDEIDWSIFGPLDVPQPQMKEPDHEDRTRAALHSGNFALAL